MYSKLGLLNVNFGVLFHKLVKLSQCGYFITTAHTLPLDYLSSPYSALFFAFIICPVRFLCSLLTALGLR